MYVAQITLHYLRLIMTTEMGYIGLIIAHWIYYVRMVLFRQLYIINNGNEL